MGAKRSAADAGFTLVETLVVLAILGIVAGASVAAIGAFDRSALAETEANRLARLIQQAADERLVTGTDINLSWDGDSYRFDTSGDDGDAIAFLGEYELPQGVRITTPATQRSVPVDDRVAMSADLAGRDDLWRVSFDGLTARADRVDE